jgi:ribose 5-phosphate isomerase B
MKVFIASDHAGFELKALVTAFLQELGYIVIDAGPFTLEPTDDYPDLIRPACKGVVRDARKGLDTKAVVIGGSGQGEAIVANRIKGIRACVYYGGSQDMVKVSRRHNDSNVLSLGARFVGNAEAKEAVLAWLNEEFMGEEHHLRRIYQIDNPKHG